MANSDGAPFLLPSSPGPNVPMDQKPGPLGALAEASTERAPLMPHV